MDIRGQRECTDCGARWSYYDTGEITCPECESVRSVGVDEPTTHTAGTAELELMPVITAIEEEPIRTLADRANEQTRSYIRHVGFIHAGELQPFSETYLAACELRRVGATLGRVMQPDETEQLYFLQLLRGAQDGERPVPEEVPETLYPERGLAIASATDAYLTDLRRYRESREDREESVDSVLSAVTTQRKRIEALDGDLDPAEAERIVRAIQDVSEYLRTDDETALARALDRVDTEQV